MDDLERLSHARIGSTLNDKWTLESLLGVGGMAAVYAARHRNGARAAIKILHPELARNKEVRERFRREGYAANKVEHPGVVRVLDDDVAPSDTHAEIVYLIMELLSGEALQDRLERGAMSEIEFLEIALGVLDVLAAAHARGVIHRDVKPENLFLAKDDGGEGPPRRVKILDFGLARLQEGVSITTYGLALGTPSFMSPEQAAGRTDEIDGRTDLFALAATGFRIRTGRKIHEADSPVDLVTKMAHLPAPPIRSVCPEVSAPFERVIDKGLQFRREDRYGSAGDMADDVRQALSELEGARTQKAPRSPGGAPEATEPSIELSDGDIVRTQYGLDESIRIPKRRSIVPWLFLLVVTGIGGKVWFDRRAQLAASQAPAPSELASATAPAPAPAPLKASAPTPVISSATSDPRPKPAASVAAARPAAPAAVPAPSASGSHHAAPKKRSPASLLKPKGH